VSAVRTATYWSGRQGHTTGEAPCSRTGSSSLWMSLPAGTRAPSKTHFRVQTTCLSPLPDTTRI